jgi:hypothetical protein
MGLGPINTTTLSTLGKSIMAGEDVRWYSPRHEFTRDRGQRKVASGASRERNCSRVEAEAHDSLAQLTPDSIALDEMNISRSSQTFVARHQDSVVCASYLQQLGAAHGRVRNNVSAEQPQPSRQSHQHPVNGESGSFVHCDRL